MTTADRAIVIDTPAGIEAFRLVTMRHALKLEITTGMKMTRFSVLKAVNAQFGTSFKRKQAALEFIEAVLAYVNGETTELPAVEGLEWQM